MLLEKHTYRNIFLFLNLKVQILQIFYIFYDINSFFLIFSFIFIIFSHFVVTILSFKGFNTFFNVRLLSTHLVNTNLFKNTFFFNKI